MTLKYSVGLFCGLFVFSVSCSLKNPDNKYKGSPFVDKNYTKGIQEIPGNLQCEYYDLGGEGIAFHDSDSTNSGSGRLNPADGSYLNEFRKNEAVDISYTKIDDRMIDNNPFNYVDPDKDQLYVGWTEPGEWLNYTVDVKTSGVYQVGIMYTSNQNGEISISVNNKDISGPLKVPSTFVAEDTIMWRQWHHWNYLENIAEVELEEGIQVLTLHTVSVGQMNYDYLAFLLKPE